MPSAVDIRQALEDEATGMDLDTVVQEVAESRENGGLNPMASAFALYSSRESLVQSNLPRRFALHRKM